LSFGVPAIVARSGALPGIIEHEESGLIFEPGDHEALAACLRKIAYDGALLERMHHGALDRVKNYSPEASADALNTFLSEVHRNRKEKDSRAFEPSGVGVSETPPT
jgi:glycosyltransferase involved in cell wall biosynthesis